MADKENIDALYSSFQEKRLNVGRYTDEATGKTYYFRAASLRTRQLIDTRTRDLGGGGVNAVIAAFITRVENEDGKPMYSWIERQPVMRKGDPDTINMVVIEMGKFDTDLMMGNL